MPALDQGRNLLHAVVRSVFYKQCGVDLHVKEICKIKTSNQDLVGYSKFAFDQIIIQQNTVYTTCYLNH